jgi:hypothetical protein
LHFLCSKSRSLAAKTGLIREAPGQTAAFLMVLILYQSDINYSKTFTAGIDKHCLDASRAGKPVLSRRPPCSRDGITDGPPLVLHATTFDVGCSRVFIVKSKYQSGELDHI